MKQVLYTTHADGTGFYKGKSTIKTMCPKCGEVSTHPDAIGEYHCPACRYLLVRVFLFDDGEEERDR